MAKKRTGMSATGLALFVGVIVLSPIAQALWAPDDWGWSLQTDLQRIGIQDVWDRSDPNGNIPDTLGTDSVLVAVIDQGFTRHADLEGRWFQNEKDGVEVGTQIDDDGNGYASDFMGWDFAHEDHIPFVMGDCGVDDTHGTQTASVIAATIDNANSGILGIGSIAGVSQVKILPLRVPMPPCPVGDPQVAENIGDAVTYARIMGADVISISVGVKSGGYGLEHFDVANAIIAAARADGILVVAPSGNEACGGPNYSTLVGWPAILEDVMAIAGTDNSGGGWFLSCDGPELELAAPAESIAVLDYDFTLNPPEFITMASGTSYSAPVVAGVAALIKSYRSDLSGDQIRQILIATAGGDGTHSDDLGWGEIRPLKALETALQVREAAYGGFPVGWASIDALIGPAYQPAADVDAFGNTHVVWIGDENSNGNAEVFYEVIDAAGHWEMTPVRVEEGSGMEGDPSDYPDIFVDGNGNAHIAWIERTATSTDGEIYYVVYGPDHDVVTQITHWDTQISPFYLGPVANLNIVVDPEWSSAYPDGFPYFVYDQLITTVYPDESTYVQSYIILRNPASGGIPTIIPLADGGEGRDPSADIGEEGVNGCVTEFASCIYYSYVSGNFADSYVYFHVVDPAGQTVVPKKEVQHTSWTYVFSAPSLDVDPASPNTALAWSRLDPLDADGAGLGSSSITFAWIDADGLIGAAYPKTLGVTGGGGKDPSATIRFHGAAGVAWTGGWPVGPGADLVYVEVSESGMETTMSAAREVSQVQVGDGPGTPNAGDPLYPQAVVPKPHYAEDSQGFDTTDGNYRFVWLQDYQGSILPHYASTRPAFSNLRFTSQLNIDISEPEIAVGNDGSYHVVYTKDLGGGNSEVRYSYWPNGQNPKNGPPIPPGGFDIAPCCWPTLGNAPRSWSPQVLFSSESQAVYAQTVTVSYVYVLYFVDVLPSAEVWMTKYLSGSSNPVINPTQFGADAGGGLNPDSLSDLDATIFNDHESSVAGLGSNTNPVNAPVPLPLEPVISAAWVERYTPYEAPGQTSDHLQFGAIDQYNNAVQGETLLHAGALNVLVSAPSVTYGPGDRAYVAYLEGTEAYMITLRVGVTPSLCGPFQQLSPGGGIETYSVVIRADHEFDRVEGGRSSSDVIVSDNQIHIVLGVEGPPVGPAASYYDAVYMRMEDVGDRTCSGNPPYLVERVSRRSILPSDATGDGYLSESIPVGISMELGPENRPIVALSATIDRTTSHDCLGCNSQVYLIGLGNSGLQEYFTAASITGAPWFSAWTPTLAVNSLHTISVVCNTQWSQPGRGNTFSVGFMEARQVDY